MAYEYFRERESRQERGRTPRVDNGKIIGCFILSRGRLIEIMLNNKGTHKKAGIFNFEFLFFKCCHQKRNTSLGKGSLSDKGAVHNDINNNRECVGECVADLVARENNWMNISHLT